MDDAVAIALSTGSASVPPAPDAAAPATSRHLRQTPPEWHHASWDAGLHPPGDGFNSMPRRPILSGMEQFALTDRAAARIAEIVAAEGQQAALRVAVLAGGAVASSTASSWTLLRRRMTW